MVKVCIICQKEVSGGAAKVKEDNVIKTIRGIKSAFKVAQNNELYVCANDLKAYQERRKRFEKDIVTYGVLALGIIVLLVGLPLLGGKFDLLILIYSIVLGAIVFLLGAMIKYVPAIEEGTVVAKTPTDQKTETKTAPQKKKVK